MLKLIIEDDEGRKTVVPFVREEITIGRQEGNTIRLTERNVSRRHARLLRQNGHVLVEDLGSSNGTRINGERISGQSSVKDGDLIQIGDYDLALQSEAAAAAKASRAAPAPAAAAKDEPSDPDASAAEPETELETPVQEEASGAPSGDQRRHSTSIIRMDHVESTRSRKVQELDPEEAPRLVVESSEFKGQEFACIRTEMRIGRTDDNDIVIDHRSLSRTHAKVVREDNGEWRVIDMQSANGLTVNGESYAQASINNGDLIELGHVKLRFVSSGEAAAAAASGGGRSKLPLVLVLLVLVAGGGAAAFFLLKPTTPVPPRPPQVTEAPKPPEEPQEATPTEPTEPEQTAQPTPPEAKPTPPETQPDPAGQADPKLAALLEEAEQALRAGNLEKAEDTLNKTKKGGKLPPEATALSEELAYEKQASKALKDGQAALKAKNYTEVDRLLALTENTTVFAKGRDQLIADLTKVREVAQPKVEPKVEPKPKPPLEPSGPEKARAAYEDALKLFKAKQLTEAIYRANQCVEFDPRLPECHLLLGAAYASNKSTVELGANHYRKFLELVPPTNERAVKVRELLDNYEKSKNNPQK